MLALSQIRTDVTTKYITRQSTMYAPKVATYGKATYHGMNWFKPRAVATFTTATLNSWLVKMRQSLKSLA